MERKLEKALEKGLDRLLNGTLENTYYRLITKGLLDVVHSKRDFLLGVVVGDMAEGLGFCIWGAHKRYPKEKEFQSLFNMIQRRSSEIQEKIESILICNQVF
jgi:hypothetical protein